MLTDTREPCPICGKNCGFLSHGSGIILKPDAIGEQDKMLTLDKRYYLNADKTKVVDEDSPDAAFLLGGPGALISEEDAKRLGLGDLAEHDLTRNSQVSRAVNGLPNRVNLDVAQVLPGDRTALQQVSDMVMERERQASEADSSDDEAPKSKPKARARAKSKADDEEEQPPEGEEGSSGEGQQQS